MLPTFVIGLREGLEAALIVGIIAAFLNQRGKSLGLMWIGVVLAVAMSIAVGIALELIERALPQAEQEAMETVIGAVAVIFVTSMIVWMTRHGHRMKEELHSELSEALTRGSHLALVGMAFLAVLREGFETAVFLLATFSAAQSGLLAAIGAALGITIAVVIGWLIYVGGVRLNMGKFFRITGAFLILVAAGLVVSALRTAHEAGWLLAGQQQVADLSWLVAPGSIQAALITGVLGIPADPRAIELVGWLAYLVPVSLYVYWPRSKRPGPEASRRIALGVSGVLALVAVVLAVAWPDPGANLPTSAPLVTKGKTSPFGGATLKLIHGGSQALLNVGNETITLLLDEDKARTERHHGADATYYPVSQITPIRNAPHAVTLNALVHLAGGRIPMGFSPARNPGPFDTEWSSLDKAGIWVANGTILDAEGSESTLLRVGGGGLQTPRTLRIDSRPNMTATGEWQVDPAYVNTTADDLRDTRMAALEQHLWARQIPLLLLIIAAITTATALRRKGATHRAATGSLPSDARS